MPSYRATVFSLLALALACAAYPLARAFWDIEIDVNEGWNAYHQVRALSGLPLYRLDSPLVANNYPPLSFYLVGMFGEIVGDPVLAGRLASLSGLAAIALASGSIVRSAGGQWTEALLAIATLLLLFATVATDYLGMNDPQLLGQAFVMAGLAVYLGGAPTGARVLAVAALFSAGLLIKHNLLAVPVLVTADLLLRGPGRARLAYLGAGLALGGLSLGLLWGLEGRAFLDQILAPREWSLDRAFLMTIQTLTRIQAPLAVVALLLLLGERRRPDGLILAYLGLGLGQAALFAGGAGTDVNLYFDVFIALAVGAGLALHGLAGRAPPSGIRIGLALAANAGALIQVPLVLGLFAVDVGGDLDYRERRFRADVAYLESVPGPALCQSHLLCFRAGRPMLYDSFNADQAMAVGRLPADSLTGMLRRHEIAVFQVSDLRQSDLPGQRRDPTAFLHFRDDVFDVLDREYRLDRVGLSGRFFRSLH